MIDRAPTTLLRDEKRIEPGFGKAAHAMELTVRWFEAGLRSGEDPLIALDEAVCVASNIVRSTRCVVQEEIRSTGMAIGC